MIRTAELRDLHAIVGIYNQAISAGFQTCFTSQVRPEDKASWLQKHLCEEYPVLVFELDTKMVGWLSISPYREGRAALKHTVEISYFVDNQYFGQGIGYRLLSYGTEACRKLNYKAALAIILEPNAVSIKLAEKCGYQRWGFLPCVADFNGAICGQYYYGINLIPITGSLY